MVATNNVTTSIRKANPSDLPQILKLVEEQAEFHGEETDDIKTNASTFAKDGFKSDDPWFECFVAEADDDIVGIAVCYKSYSTWKGRAYHLDDLIITRRFRGQGLGHKLFQAAAERAVELGAQRFDWIVLKDNDRAIAFYENHGAEIDETWATGKLEGTALTALSQPKPSAN